jgi:hypothetical protein
VGAVKMMYVAAVEVISGGKKKGKKGMKLSLPPPELVEKLVWVPVILL